MPSQELQILELSERQYKIIMCNIKKIEDKIVKISKE